MNCAETLASDAGLKAPVHFSDKALGFGFSLVLGARAGWLVSPPQPFAAVSATVALPLQGGSLDRASTRTRLTGDLYPPTTTLTWLHFDGVWQVHGALHQLSDRHVLSVLHVPREHTRLQPLKAPGVFDGDDRIQSRNHA